jgi:membrane-associated phospholipid phosphatase
MTTTEDERRVADPAPGTDSSLLTLPAEPGDGRVASKAPRRTFGQFCADRWTDPGRRKVTIGWGVLVVSLVIYFFVAGIPWSTDWVFIYITAGLVISSLGTGVKWKRLLKDWLPLFLVLTGYGLLRGYASHTLWGPLVRPQTWFDRLIGGGTVPTATLQRWLYTPFLHGAWFNIGGLPFYDYICWGCYMSHFFTSFIIAGVLWKTNYAKFRRYVPMFVGLTFIGYVTYVLYPAMPPWMASQLGYMPHITRLIPIVLDHLHFHTGAAIFTGGPKFDNNVAAMPSLHAGYTALICLFFWKGSSVRKRVLLVAYPLLMAFTLVYTGEHFVIDIFIGWLYAAATVYFGNKLLNAWDRRQARKRALSGERSEDLGAGAVTDVSVTPARV